MLLLHLCFLSIKLPELILMLSITILQSSCELCLELLDLVEMCLLLLERQVVELLLHSFLILVLPSQLLVMILIDLLNNLMVLALTIIHLVLQVLNLLEQDFSFPNELLVLGVVSLRVFPDRMCHSRDMRLQLTSLVF